MQTLMGTVLISCICRSSDIVMIQGHRLKSCAYVSCLNCGSLIDAREGRLTCQACREAQKVALVKRYIKENNITDESYISYLFKRW